jgi:hypothetical protein
VPGTRVRRARRSSKPPPDGRNAAGPRALAVRQRGSVAEREARGRPGESTGGRVVFTPARGMPTHSSAFSYEAGPPGLLSALSLARPACGSAIPERLHGCGIIRVVGALRIVDPLGRSGDGCRNVNSFHRHNILARAALLCYNYEKVSFTRFPSTAQSVAWWIPSLLAFFPKRRRYL